MSMIEKERKEREAEGDAGGDGRGTGSLPWGFEQRAKVREAEAKAYGAAEARHAAASPAGPPAAASPSLASAFGADRHQPPPGVFVDTPAPAAAHAGVPLGSPAGPSSPESALLHVAVTSRDGGLGGD